MKKLFTIFALLIIAILSSSGALVKVQAAADDYSSVDSDLAGFGMEPAEFKLDMTSNQEPSCLMFAESIVPSDFNVSNGIGPLDIYYNYLYIYNPQGIENYNLKQLQLSYATKQTDNLSDTSDLLTLYYDVQLLSINSIKTVAKYLVKGLDLLEHNLYRLYLLRQFSYSLKSDTTPIIRYQTLGDQYIYYTYHSEDGTITSNYDYQKMNYLTFTRKLSNSYLLEDGDLFWNGFKLSVGGQEYWFYGFSTEDYEIQQLYDMDFYYYKYDYVCYYPYKQLDVGCYNDTSIISRFNPVKSNSNYTFKKVAPSEVVHESTGAFFGKYIYKWNSISSYTLASNNSNTDFKNFIKKYYINYDWIVNFDQSNYFLNHGTTFPYTQNENNNFASWLINHGSVVIDDGYPQPEYSKYIGKYMEDVEITRLTFKSNGKIYNLNVITNPITPIDKIPGSTGDPEAGATPCWPH